MEKDIYRFTDEHKYINYCECIISPDGLLEYANPSHVESLIRKTGKSREEIYNEMKIDDSPIYWLVDKTNYIAVYTSGYIKPKQTTEKQEEALNILIDKGLTGLNAF